MLSAGHSHWMITVKKYAYLLVVIPPALLLLSQWLWERFGYTDLFAYFVLCFVFGLIPVLDHVVGQDPVNPDEQQEVPRLSDETFYRVLTLLCLPMQLATIAWGGHVFMTTEMSWVGQLGWLLSVGTVGAIVAINVGHELIHKDPLIEQWTPPAHWAEGIRARHRRARLSSVLIQELQQRRVERLGILVRCRVPRVGNPFDP